VVSLAKTNPIEIVAVMLPTSSSVAETDQESFVENPAATQYLLVCQAQSTSLTEGTWSFTLETAEGESVLAAEDVDFGDLNRLTLLAAVRGLESIDGPASVLLLSNNRYLIRSLSESLPRWRENQFVWEHFGRRIDVQHADLWRRIDRALQIHCVQACLISSRFVSTGRPEPSASRDKNPWQRIDAPHAGVPTPKAIRAPRDGLRRWLLAGVANQAGHVPRHRFTAADLLESA
jgi:ribonuclease HI